MIHIGYLSLLLFCISTNMIHSMDFKQELPQSFYMPSNVFTPNTSSYPQLNTTHNSYLWNDNNFDKKNLANPMDFGGNPTLEELINPKTIPSDGFSITFPEQPSPLFPSLDPIIIFASPDNTCHHSQQRPKVTHMTPEKLVSSALPSSPRTPPERLNLSSLDPTTIPSAFDYLPSASININNQSLSSKADNSYQGDAIQNTTSLLQKFVPTIKKRKSLLFDQEIFISEEKKRQYLNSPLKQLQIPNDCFYTIKCLTCNTTQRAQSLSGLVSNYKRHLKNNLLSKKHTKVSTPQKISEYVHKNAQQAKKSLLYLIPCPECHNHISYSTFSLSALRQNLSVHLKKKNEEQLNKLSNSYIERNVKIFIAKEKWSFQQINESKRTKKIKINI